MKGFMYESQGAEAMLVYCLGEDEHLDSFAKGMLQSNEMTGILRPSFLQKDSEQYLKFPVTSKISLKEFIRREMERETTLNLIFTMANAIQEVEEYMLSPEKIYFDPEYIFVNIRRKEANFLYIPVDEFKQNISVKDFFLYLLSHMQFQLEQDISYVAKLIHFLNQEKLWTCQELKRYIQELQSEHERPLCQMKKDVTISSLPDAGHLDMQCRETPMLPKELERNAGDKGMNSEKSYEIIPVAEMALCDIEQSNTPVIHCKCEEKKKGGLFSFGKKKEKNSDHNREESIDTVSTSVNIPPMAIPGQLQEADIWSQEPTSMPVFESPQPTKKTSSGKWRFGKSKRKLSVENSIAAASTQSTDSKKGQITPNSQRTPYDPIHEQRSSNFSYPYIEKEKSIYISHGNSEDENSTVILGAGMEYNATMILGTEQEDRKAVYSHVVKITRRRTGQSMVINKGLFRIGSEAGFVDLYIGDNLAIGSCHANICEENGAYYIIDQNSINHTYVNGIMIQPMHSVQLISGSIITLADEDFDFMIS